METQKPISPLRQRMIDDMRMRKLCDKTQTGYLRAVRQFAKYLGRSPDTATVEELRNYQLHLVDHGISPVSLNAAITGLKFFCEITLSISSAMEKNLRIPLGFTLQRAGFISFSYWITEKYSPDRPYSSVQRACPALYTSLG